MRLRGEREFRAEELYDKLINSLYKHLKSEIELIAKQTTDLNEEGMESIYEVYRIGTLENEIYKSLLTLDLNLPLINTLLKLEDTVTGGLLRVLVHRVDSERYRININNQEQLKEFIMDTIAILGEIYESSDYTE